MQKKENGFENEDVIKSTNRILELALLSGCIDYQTAKTLTPKELVFFANLYIEQYNKQVCFEYLNAYFNRIKKLPDIKTFFLDRIGEKESKHITTKDDFEEIMNAIKGDK